MTPSGSDEVRQRLSAILFADVVNYSGAMERDQIGTHRRVMRRVNLFRSLIGDYEGRIFDIEGDAVKAVFDSAFQAVRFAVDLQREFRNDAVWGSDPDEPVFRIGINLGEVIEEAHGYYGHEVNVAARLQELAPAGGICISESVQRVVRGKLPVQMLPIGRRSLKNMAETVEAFAIDLEGKGTAVVPIVRTPENSIQSSARDASVVVLPLKNLSGDASDLHLCDGIAGDIITNLSRFRDISVIARHSAFFFRDTDVDLREVSSQIGARYALTGGLQRDGHRLRLSVQLIDTESESILWSDRYKGDLSDIFAFQDDITAVIASQLAIHISLAEQKRARTMAPSDLRAYGMVLRGQDLSLQIRKDATLHARRLFEEATRLDPKYCRSYAGISRTFNIEWRYRWSDRPEASLKRAVEFAVEATQLDNFDARGHSELGFAYLYKKEHQASLAAYDRAYELNPNDADILADMADALTYADQPGKAVEIVKRAIRLNPLCPDWYYWGLGDAYFVLGEYAEAVSALQKMRDQSEAHRLMASCKSFMGLHDEARRHAAQLLLVHPEFSIEHWRNVPPYQSAEPLERFIEGLRRAGLN